MRQFILGGDVAYTTATDFNAIADGALGVFYDKDGVQTVTADGTHIKNKGMLVLGRPASAGGPISLPIHKNNFSYVKGEYEAATTFEATITVPAPTAIGTYSIIIAKKGKKFNERTNYTADEYVKDTSISATQLAQKLVDRINGNSISSGVTATLAGAIITIKATEKGKDYEVICADELMGVTVTVTTQGKSAYGDATYVTDLSNKAAADAGINYTYSDGVELLYPNYPLNPLAQPDKTDSGYTIFTIRFAEPRDVKTRDEVIHQIVQVALPTGADQIATLETVFKAIAG